MSDEKPARPALILPIFDPAQIKADEQSRLLKYQEAVARQQRKRAAKNVDVVGADFQFGEFLCTIIPSPLAALAFNTSNLWILPSPSHFIPWPTEPQTISTGGICVNKSGSANVQSGESLALKSLNGDAQGPADGGAMGWVSKEQGNLSRMEKGLAYRESRREDARRMAREAFADAKAKGVLMTFSMFMAQSMRRRG